MNRTDVELALPRGIDVIVEPDGSVLVHDEIAGHYTRVHSLPDETLRLARERAAMVWRGTHYAVAGTLFPVRKS